MKKFLLLIASLLASVGLTQAALVWENPVANLQPKVSDETAVAHFKYKNTGDKPVKITAVHPSCGCTTAAPPKEAIAPGASGVIDATFHIGNRTGEQTKTIHVTTDEPNDPGTTLTLNATIPQVLEVKPIFLYWTRNQKLDPKTVTAKLGGDFPVKDLKLTCTDPQIKTAVTPAADGKSFQISITPETTNRPVVASLKIQPDFPKEKPKYYYVYLRVDAHPAAATAGSPAAK